MNINGTYTSENGDFVLTITDSNESNSTFSGSIVSKFSPQGQQTLGITGRWFYVNNPGGSLTPLNIGFTAVARPDNRAYCIEDAWTGVLTQPGKIIMNGIRSYLPAGGQYQLILLGTNQFSTS